MVISQSDKQPVALLGSVTVFSSHTVMNTCLFQIRNKPNEPNFQPNCAFELQIILAA